MRSVWFYLRAELSLIETALQRAGAVRVGHDHIWNYPAEDARLFISLGPFAGASDDPEELAEFRAATNNELFLSSVHVDVSGRVAGDDHVREIARVLLGAFEGYAFDDFTWPHAWSLDAIATNAVHDGLHFFDYVGSFERTRAKAE